MKEGIKVSSQEAQRIEAATREQGGGSSIAWGRERQCRLTASHFGDVINMTERRDVKKLCESMYSPPNLNHVPAIRHGQTYESVAVAKFSEVTGKKVRKSGLCIDPDLPFLGASPDGFIEGEDAVIEVKCPYEGRSSKISQGTRKHFSFLEVVDGKLRLKKNHKYMYQIMGQMRLSKRSYGYFVVFTHKDLHYEVIRYDDDLFKNSMLPKLKSFYDNEYCPYVASVLKQ